MRESQQRHVFSFTDYSTNTSVPFGDRRREIVTTVLGLKNIRRLPWLQCLHFIYTDSPPVDKNFVSSLINREERWWWRPSQRASGRHDKNCNGSPSKKKRLKCNPWELQGTHPNQGQRRVWRQTKKKRSPSFLPMQLDIFYTLCVNRFRFWTQKGILGICVRTPGLAHMPGETWQKFHPVQNHSGVCARMQNLNHAVIVSP